MPLNRNKKYQDVININHKNSVNDLIQLGREIEKTVLYKAVKSHLEHKIIVHNNKTIVWSNKHAIVCSYTRVLVQSYIRIVTCDN